jgi:anti-sigma factor RsiW
MDENRPNPENSRVNDRDVPVEGDHNDLTSELVAYLDGELDRQENEAVGAKISLDPAVRAEANALKQTWDLLDHLPRAEPSTNFTERTIEKIEPLRQSGSSSSASGQAAAKSGPTAAKSGPAPQHASTAQAPILDLPRRSFPHWIAVCAVWLLLAGGAGVAGYYIRGLAVALNRMDQQEQDAKILSERRLLENLPNYRHIDDLKFLEDLDNPDLFGEEQSVPINEGPR